VSPNLIKAKCVALKPEAPNTFTLAVLARNPNEHL
jgi:hypothetical protein